MKTNRFPGSLATAAILALFFAPGLASAELIVNGGFESGLSGWTRLDQLGSDGTFFLQSGTTSPVNGDPVPAPPGGLNAAMTDSQAGGSHVLYQDFIVPAGLPEGILKFDLFLGNRAGTFVTPTSAGLDWTTPALNQQVRVDILRGGTDPFSVSSADVLFNAYQSKPGDLAVSGYKTITVGLNNIFVGQVGQTMRLRFAEVDNLAPLQMGVDNVSLIAVVPEPSSLILATLAGVIALPTLVYRRRRRVVPTGS